MQRIKRLLRKVGTWCLRRLVRLDEWSNRHLQNGYKRETFSSRGGKAVLRTRANAPEPGDWKWCLLCRWLDQFEDDHCVKHVQYNRGRPVEGK